MEIKDLSLILIQELRGLRIDLTIYWGMLRIEQGFKVPKFVLTTLERKDYIEMHSDNTYNLTPNCIRIMEQLKQLENKEDADKTISSIKNHLQTEKEKYRQEFEEWWGIFPATNAFVHNNINFTGMQSKKLKKENCFDLYQKLRMEYTKEELIETLQYHLWLAKEESVKENENKLSFIPNSERYLRERRFEPYIELRNNKRNLGDNTTFEAFEL